MPTAADIGTNVDAALEALEAGNYATARIKLLKAEAIIASLPNTTREALALQWRDAFAGLRSEIRRLMASAGGFQSQQMVVHDSPDYESEFD